MVVDEAVVAALQVQSHAHRAIFVASCAERMVQMFTGLFGDDPARGDDVDVVIRLMEDLWGLAVPVDYFHGHMRVIEGFPEFEPRDVEIVDVASIYSFYSALALRYATLYRLNADVSDALKCAHACLTAMGQLDRNTSGSRFFVQEMDSQRSVISSSISDRVDEGALLHLREHDRVVSRERLIAIQSRLDH